MGAIMKFMDKYIIPVAGKLGAQRHLVAVRDGFVAMIPITMIGALATLVNNLPIPAYQNFMKNTFGETWTTLGGDLWWGSIATMALFLVVGVAYNLAKSYDEDGLQAGLIALSIFFVMSPQVANIVTEAGDKVSGWGFVPSGYISNSALFTAIVIGLLATEIFVKLSRIKKINIKMPDGVPPAVARSFAKLIPGMLTIAIFGAIGLLIKSLSGGLFLNDLLNTYLAAPLKGAADSLGSTMLITFFIHALWTIGLHGANIAMPITETLLMDLGAENAALAQAGATEGFHTLAGAFLDAFVYLGGSGMILGLIIALIIAGRRRKDMIALGLAPSVFNISEPVIFGLPIVLNPIYMIPFVLAPVVCSAVAYLAIDMGLVMPVIAAKIPWVTPPILGGFLATGHWTGAALAAVNLLISIVIYIPFVIAAEKIDKRKATLATDQGNDDDFSFDDLEF
ncbi:MULTISPECIES: PTS sugar transporter subunit IIC [Paraclostridium]|uniref:Permease IIC component n=1 Tax=Paraclostridium bifermentans TaxID=1490 RepID=A0A5P3XCQ7_PARBF|nr:MULTISPECIES: PTS transporter subunit EIIC [Paraclostridium]KGJ48169.1 PTS cellobiose transporter subunit IIC [Clostridium sp. NCR]MCU9808243.1 PTS transporter subunit EIIC [Paraclostridium sp. AKS46]EQK47894.1 PTS system, lactose/cellobiose IIC component family protein [[Clostridium] bifermentans ATCC 19299] [Paraclostridium bifermentans ATCC 19299]MBN8049316.1 PTS sugar transporter subunit IIC [Paraclostridium bifermentans]MCE9677262.1 PTS transporter subunit EIIC [Paraclostridium biferme